MVNGFFGSILGNGIMDSIYDISPHSRPLQGSGFNQGLLGQAPTATQLQQEQARQYDLANQLGERYQEAYQAEPMNLRDEHLRNIKRVVRETYPSEVDQIHALLHPEQVMPAPDYFQQLRDYIAENAPTLAANIKDLPLLEAVDRICAAFYLPVPHPDTQIETGSRAMLEQLGVI